MILLTTGRADALSGAVMEPPLPRPSPGSDPNTPHWMSVLAGSSPREILARLVEGDPLEIRARCEQRLRAQAILLDSNRLYLRTVAHVARNAPGYQGTPPIDVWIADKIRRSVGELLDEEAERARDGELAVAPSDPELVRLAQALGIEPMALSAGMVAFNRAPYEVRSAFHGLILEGARLGAWCEANGASADRAKSALRRALWALGVRGELDIDAFLAGRDEEGGPDG